ncbi:hypothetical protein M0805_008492 [Coniferiporia weirii]|nr:hypothetical protein M0805_008492 [Coniferiporia weirii]
MSEPFFPSYSLPALPAKFDSVHPSELLPLLEPPASLLLYPPVLPLDARKRTEEPCRVSNDFLMSTHLLPAAYPCSVPFTLLPNGISSSSYAANKEERKARAKLITEEILLLKNRQSRGGSHENRLLWNCINRYTRINPTPRGKKSVTLLLTHANGFSREIWEPFLRHLVSSYQSSRDGTVSVDEIWAFEAVQHGDSAFINQDRLGHLYDWSDYARDILNFLTRYLPSERNPNSLPVYLPRIPDQTTRARLSTGLTDRTLVAIGHSFGGCAAALAAITTPCLFTGLLLVDPVIAPPYVDRSGLIYDFVIGAVQRRSEWADRDEARRLFAASPFFSVWDPEVLETYISCCLTEIERDNDVNKSTQGVKLKMSGIQEGVVFSDGHVSKEVFERIQDLDPRIMLRWVMSGKGPSMGGSDDATRDIVWRRPVNSSNIRIASSGHLIVQEAPRELALEVRTFLERVLSDARNFGRAKL